MHDVPDGGPPQEDVVVIGSGPAGLGAAIALRERGVDRVIVLEREGEAGGIPRQCGHPPYGVREFGRLMTGPTYARRLRERANAAGVEIRTRTSVVALGAGGTLTLATPAGATTLSPQRVILATGARETPRSARLLSGTRPLGVVNTATLQDCIYLKGLTPFRRPVIVGTELVALSALWTCIRHGIRPVAVIEGRDRATARWPLGLFPRLLRIPAYYEAGIIAIEGGDTVEAIRVSTPKGERRIVCDGVVLSGNFVPEASLARSGGLALDPGTGGPLVDQFGRCSDPAYFAAGNLLRPIETAGWCHREGQRTGHAVADDLSDRLPSPDAHVRLLTGSGIGWLVPQRLALRAGTPPSGAIQLRADAPVSGRLTLRQGGRLLWSRRIATRPERRLRIPAAAVGAIGPGEDVLIAIEPGR